MPSDEQEIARSMRLVAVAVASAVITATVVIGAGQFWIARSSVTAPSEGNLLVQTGG